jgi:hypothetical protein
MKNFTPALAVDACLDGRAIIRRALLRVRRTQPEYKKRSIIRLVIGGGFVSRIVRVEWSTRIFGLKVLGGLMTGS